MNRIAKLGLGFFLLVLPARAQTISPVIVEYQEKARGSFQIRNDAFVPLTVVLEAKSFSVDAKGEPLYRSLDPEIRLELSAKSFRVGPQQTYTVFYRASAEVLPAWFTIYASITGPTAPNGIKLVLELPHTVYLLTRQPLDGGAIVFHRAGTGGPKAQVTLEVENRSQQFGRVREVEITSATARKTYPGFPFFPRQRRTLVFDWDQEGVPAKVVLKFNKFQVEQLIRPPSYVP